jgi:hypothetical protein
MIIFIIVVVYAVLVYTTFYNINEVLFSMHKTNDPRYYKILTFLIKIGFTAQNTAIAYICLNMFISLVFSILVLLPCLYYLYKKKKD